MKITIVALAIAVLLVSCNEEIKTVEQREIKQYAIEQFMDNESVRGGSFSADNSNLIVSSNRSGIYNVYSIPAKGGEMTPVTSSDSVAISAESYFPSDDRMLLSADGNGDEIDHLFVRELDGTIKDITPEKDAKSMFYGWSKDDQSLYFGSNKRDAKFFDVYKMNTDGYTSEMIHENKDGLNFSAISEDENYFALWRNVTRNDDDLFIYNVATREMTKVNDNQSKNSSQGFSKDNSTFYYTTDDGSEFSYLMSYNIATSEKKRLVEKSWDVAGISLTSNGSYMVIYVNEDGKDAVEVLDTKTMKAIDLPDFGANNITNVSFSDNEEWLRMYVGGSNTPSNLYTYNLKTQEQYKLTNVLNEEIDIADLVTAKVVRYESFDGTSIPAIYYLPLEASATNKVPAMVWVHGGPGGQSRQDFSSLIQYIVNHGYAVLAVNNRGSSGYGKTFYQMDDLNHGEKDLQDCIEGKNWLATQADIDGEKIGILGGSYGGYMTMAALTFTPEEFDVGVNIFGVTNWLRTLKSIPPYWESRRKSLYLELGDPFTEDSIRLKKISPLFHTDKVTKPLIVLQGSQDPRVLQVESDEIVEGVRKNGVPVEYVLFDDEGHGFEKKENQIEAYSKILAFLDKYLKQENTGKDASLDRGAIEPE